MPSRERDRTGIWARRGVRTALLLIFLCLASWLFPAAVAPSLVRLLHERLPVNTEVASAATHDGYRFAIHSLQWKDERLICRFRCSREGEEAGRIFDRPWDWLECRFWDAGGVPVKDTIRVDYVHDLGFFLGKQNDEWIEFAIQPPEDAARIAVEYWGPLHATKPTALPARPRPWW
jgi:hypothetical protein